jgi:hypothetical protein
MKTGIHCTKLRHDYVLRMCFDLHEHFKLNEDIATRLKCVCGPKYKEENVKDASAALSCGEHVCIAR